MKLTLRRAKDRPRRTDFTVLILPHSRSRFRKLHLSRGFVVTLGLVLVVALVAGIYSPHLLFRMQTQSAALENLSRQNRELRAESDYFESRLAEISEQLGHFESQTGRIASALGIDDLPSHQPAAGGPAPEAAPAGAGRRRSMLDEELGALQSRGARVDDSLEQLNAAFEKRMARMVSTPNRMPVDGWFSHGFGWRKDPFNGRRQFHRGIDIVADTGTPVNAPADGLVSRATRDPGLGKTIDISHGYGLVTRYAHMSEILVRPGERIERGDLVGRVGSTGRSTGPHLHYEVFRDGRRVNPWKYLGQSGR